MDDRELFDWTDDVFGRVNDEAQREPWERWEDADTMELDESGYFRELGRRLALERG